MISKDTLPTLTTGCVRLRPLMRADLSMTLGWRNQDNIRRWFFHSDIISLEQHNSWFDVYENREDDFTFIIEERAMLRRAVGQVALYHIDWDQGRAEFGRLMIGEPMARGLGLAKQATQMLLEFAEARLGLAEIYLEVYVANLPAIALYRTCGFVTDDTRDDIVRMLRKSAPLYASDSTMIE